MGQQANYGIDAPQVVLRFALIGMGGIALGIILILVPIRAIPRGLAIGLGFACMWTGVWFAALSVFMVWGSRVAKLRLRDRIIASIPWRGDEIVLDVGCGHGLMLIGAAKRLSTGKAIGLDLWQKEDQAGNSPEATRENARCENVGDRIELRDGDARKMPFADSTFDVILSSWALHNIYDAPGRTDAVGEIIRVLKPGGRLAIVDIRHTREYEQVLCDAGLKDVERRGPSFIFAIPSYTVTASKTVSAESAAHVNVEV